MPEQFDLFNPPKKPSSVQASGDKSAGDEELMPAPDEVVHPSEADEREAFEAEHPGTTYIPPKTRADREAASRRKEAILRRARVDILGEKGQPSLPRSPKRGR